MLRQTDWTSRAWLRLSAMLLKDLLSFSTLALTTQAVLTQPSNNGEKSLKSSRRKVFSHSSTLPTKGSHPEILRKMLTQSDCSMSWDFKWSSLRALPRTSVFMVKELVPSISLPRALKSQRSSILSSSNLYLANVVFSSILRLIVRPMYSNPPIHGALIVKKVLGNPEYYKEWERELKMVSQRIQDMRRLLFEELNRLKVKGNWDHIINQIGMFSFTGLTRNTNSTLWSNLLYSFSKTMRCLDREIPHLLGQKWKNQHGKIIKTRFNTHWYITSAVSPPRTWDTWPKPWKMLLKTTKKRNLANQ